MAVDENGVPILALGSESQALVDEAHTAFVETGDHGHLLTGAVVLLDNRRPVGAPDTPDVTRVTVGGETLDEALKSCVGLFDAHGHQVPRWVAASEERLAALLAEHYGCKVKALEKAVAK